MWPFNKRREDRWEEFFTNSIPVTTLVRWYMYDAGVDTPNTVVKEFDMTPASEEGEQKEEEDSRARIARVLPLFPFIAVMAEINAKTISTIQKQQLFESGTDLSKLEKEYEFMKEFYEQVGFSGLVTAFSAAAELGLVEITGTFSDIEKREY